MNDASLLQQARELIGSTPEHLNALFISGAAGAYVRAVFAPESSWKRRAFEGSAGAISAIFLGGVLGHLIDMLTGAETYAYLAGGFIMGEGGIVAVQAIRRKFIGDETP
jgi:hypothetical protein